MKTLIMALSVLFSGYATAQSVSEVRKILLSDLTHPVTVELNEQTVRCSNLGYSSTELKVSVPALTFLARLDHRNLGEDQPCMTAGRCAPSNLPEDVIGNGPRSERTEIRIVLEEELYLNLVDRTCTRTVTETLSATIAGKPFTHRAYLNLGEYPFDLCSAVPAQPANL
jgi:hypothetical protein